MATITTPRLHLTPFEPTDWAFFRSLREDRNIGLHISPENREEADIGYTVVPAAQGKGIASEALRAVCEYAFNQTGVKAINAYVLADNGGSVRVLEKAGFVRTQVLEKAYEIDGVRYDDWVYRLECGTV